MHDERAHTEDERARDDRRAETDPEAGTSADVSAPFAPHKDDDSPFGDTDQHSTA
ncbi:MAG: hypothetical protein ACR2NR_17285 [Solirubrobacteraceae bacterium]